MTETIELSIDSKLEFVDLVASVTKSVTAKIGFEEEDASWIELAGSPRYLKKIPHRFFPINQMEVWAAFTRNLVRWPIHPSKPNRSSNGSKPSTPSRPIYSLKLRF